MCTHDRYEALAEALASLNQQTLPSSDYEIIVVDNSSNTARQRRFWKGAQRRYSAIVKFQSEPGLAKARNAGLNAAGAPLVAYCDDDSVASPDWLASLVRLFEDEPNAGIAGGPVSPIWPDAPPEWLHPWMAGFFTIVDHGPLRRRLLAHEWLAGTNIAFRRDLLLGVGGFDETLGRRGSLLLSNEELDITRRLLGAGFASYYEPSAIMRHKVDESRVSQAWLRRRVVWQAISNALASDAVLTCEAGPCWSLIAEYALRVPPEMRGLRGLFLDTTDGEMLKRQCEAIGELMKIMMFDAEDPERLAKK